MTRQKSNLCRYGKGRYGSPKTAPNCDRDRMPRPKLFCAEHERWWRETSPKRSAAKRARYLANHPEARLNAKAQAAPKAKAAKASTRDAKARAAVSCTRCGADAGSDCIWGRSASKRVHAARLQLFDGVSLKK